MLFRDSDSDSSEDVVRLEESVPSFSSEDSFFFSSPAESPWRPSVISGDCFLFFFTGGFSGGSSGLREVRTGLSTVLTGDFFFFSLTGRSSVRRPRPTRDCVATVAAAATEKRVTAAATAAATSSSDRRGAGGSSRRGTRPILNWAAAAVAAVAAAALRSATVAAATAIAAAVASSDRAPPLLMPIRSELSRRKTFPLGAAADAAAGSRSPRRRNPPGAMLTNLPGLLDRERARG